MPGFDAGQAGLYAPMNTPWSSLATAVALTANRAYFTRFVCPRNMAISKITFSVAAGSTADDQVDVGIFDAAITALLGSSGPVSGKLNLGSPNNSICNLQAPVNLQAGQVYYVAHACGPIGGTAAQIHMANLTNAQLAQLVGSAAPLTEARYSTSLFPLATPVGGGGGTTVVPIFALRI